jgi:hypothetical protein
MTFNPPIGAHMQFQQPLQPVSMPDADFDQPEELFNVNTANHWLEQASARPVPKMLFGKFWFEGQIEQATKLKLEGKTLRDIAGIMNISYQKADRLIKAPGNKA